MDIIDKVLGWLHASGWRLSVALIVAAIFLLALFADVSNQGRVQIEWSFESRLAKHNQGSPDGQAP